MTMTYWLQREPDAGGDRRDPRRRATTRRPRGPSKIPPIIETQIAVLGDAGHDLGRRAAAGRRLGGDRRGVRRPARLDRADPPSRTSGPRASHRSTSSCPPIWRRSRERLDARSRGHVRRAADRDLARRRRQVPRPPPPRGWGGDRIALLDGPDGRLGHRLADGLGHARPMRPSSRPRRPRGEPTPGKGSVLPGEGGTSAGS